MKIPDAYIVGAAKSGTTSLFRYLLQHPGVFESKEKEPSFFTTWRPRGAPDLATLGEYSALYEECPPDQIAIDASPAYLYDPQSAQRIRALAPAARIIILLRNPIDRAYSLYWHHRRDGHESVSFEEALRLEPQRIREGWPFGFHYVRSGLYFDQVRRYLEGFEEQHVILWLFEDLCEDPGRLVRRTGEMLGLEPFDYDTDRVHNRSGLHRNRALGWLLSYPHPLRRLLAGVVPERVKELRRDLVQRNLDKPPPMKPSTRKRLVEAFEDDVSSLEGLIGKDLSSWKARDGARD